MLLICKNCAAQFEGRPGTMGCTVACRKKLKNARNKKYRTPEKKRQYSNDYYDRTRKSVQYHGTERRYKAPRYRERPPKVERPQPSLAPIRMGLVSW